MMQSSTTKADFTHTPCYCEENTLLLLKQLISQLPSDTKGYAVFVSNPSKSIPIWHQTKGNPVSSTSFLVYDLDSTLPFPSTAEVYSKLALPILDPELTKYHRYYRVVEAHEYFKTFASDRRHMQKDGEWMAPPPSYPGFESEGTFFNLDVYWTMGPDDVEAGDRGDGFGRVFDEDGFHEWLQNGLEKT
ncbi:hypothetical protein BCR33DRAFT_714926 [Rhizoclosmatium globosum]|uniref:Protein N-terminal glutamine amidohydrolase n=1 Tax=Rhizoclosmatium globosum TaxID=329046 RepID=A0A1Y2CLG8_9FUNG|nr:hypothetical protein BCR33DRAFT_714926 [Rhizoclosmatium globosum]|eukprot:ORY47872.1 hypothetical protein BCR33DRAFT_714926 [Rhizoclosmatium globosum]